MKTDRRISRRAFLGGSAAGAALFLGAPLHLPKRFFSPLSPNETIHFAVIGTGGMGMADIDRILACAGTRIVAIVDVDRAHRDLAKAKVDRAQKANDCRAFNDHREILKMKDVDAVLIATPDHWHATIAVEAARAKKDIYVEKPLSHTIREGRAIVDAVQQNGRVGQTGTQQRSEANFRLARALVRAGKIGAVRSMDVRIPAQNKLAPASYAEEPIPQGFDYDRWLGPAPYAPFTRQRCHYNFRFISDYALGQVTNWGVHYVDIAQWILGPAAAPIEVRGNGVFPTTGLFDVATHVDFTVLYPNDIRLDVVTRRDGAFDGELLITGENGKIRVNRTTITADDKEILKSVDVEAVLGTKQKPHMQDFVDAIRARSSPVADVADGHRSTTTTILGHLAMYLRRPLLWDAAGEAFVDDEPADRFLVRAARAPYALE